MASSPTGSSWILPVWLAEAKPVEGEALTSHRPVSPVLTAVTDACLRLSLYVALIAWKKK